MPRKPKIEKERTREPIPRKAKTRSAEQRQPKLVLSQPKKESIMILRKPPEGKKPKKPTYLAMVKKAITETQENGRKGAADIVIIRYIHANYPVYGNFKPHVRLALSRAVATGLLKQHKRHFRIAEKTKKKKTGKRKTSKKTGNAKKEKTKKEKTKKSPKKQKTKEPSPRKSKTATRPAKEKPAPRGKKSSRGSTSSASAETAELVWVWQFMENDKCFYNYESDASDVVESVYQDYLKNPGNTDVRSVKSGQWHYMVDFREMTQQNIQHENHTKRRIRRIQVPAAEKTNSKKAYPETE